MASKHAQNDSATKGRATRGGRRPGSWEVVTPKEIVTFREEQGLSRARLAEMLDVSTTSIQNWETGRVASRRIQERLRTVIDGGTLPDARCSEAAEVAHGWANGARDQATISTIGQIVTAYLGTQRGMKPGDVAELVRSVKQALTP